MEIGSFLVRGEARIRNWVNSYRLKLIDCWHYAVSTHQFINAGGPHLSTS